MIRKVIEDDGYELCKQRGVAVYYSTYQYYQYVCFPHDYFRTAT